MEIFRTLVPVPETSLRIKYSSKLMFMGSCFSENIGDKFRESKFCIDNNPYGIVYNPLSIKKGLLRLIEKKYYQTDELFEQDGVWYSFDHHSRFSGSDKNLLLQNINQQLLNSAEFLKTADFLFITFGTSLVYELKINKQAVSNCHKLPSNTFERRKISIDEIITNYSYLLNELFNYNPDIYVIFTVSPVRHWQDGAHGNQLSKATLLLATDKICKQFNKTFYFPSYEIMLDDLRDYRFYADDMFHPDNTAINYIWQKVTESFMDTETILIMNEIEKIVQAFNHKPFNAKSVAFREFSNTFLEKINILKEKYNIDFLIEEKYFRSFL